MHDWIRAAEAAILGAAALEIAGEAKREQAVDALIAWADREIRPKNPLAEAASDWALRHVVRPLAMAMIEQTYQRLRERALV